MLLSKLKDDFESEKQKYIIHSKIIADVSKFLKKS